MSHSQGSLPALNSDITPDGAWGLYGILEIEHRSTASRLEIYLLYYLFSPTSLQILVNLRRKPKAQKVAQQSCMCVALGLFSATTKTICQKKKTWPQLFIKVLERRHA